MIFFRKYDGRGKIYIERDDETGHWQVKPRSWLKTGNQFEHFEFERMLFVQIST